MKKIVLTLVAIVPAVIAIHAQATLPSSSFPTTGETFTSILADTSGVNAGTGGAAMTWNFSSLTNSGQMEVDSFKTVSSTPYSSSFPTATISVHSVSPTVNTYIYFKNTGSTVERVGNADPSTGNIVPYSNTAIEYEFPFTYGNTYNDTYYASYVISSGTVHAHGTTAATGDGYGTLTTPLGTYSNVERITSIRHEVDTVILSAGTVTLVLNTTYTNWYQTSKFFPLLSIVKTDVTPSVGSPSHSKTVSYWMGTPTGINELSANGVSETDAYPNPVNDNVTLRYSLKEKDNVKISLTDITGKIVFTANEEQNEGEQLYKINTTGFSKGLYFYSVETGNSRSNGKLVIVK